MLAQQCSLGPDDTGSAAVRMQFDMQLDMVIDDVPTEKAEEFAGTIETAVLGAVDLKLRLSGDTAAIHSGDHGRKFNGLRGAPERKIAVQLVVGSALGGALDFSDGVNGAFRYWVAGDVEKVRIVQMADQHGIPSRIG